MHSLRRFLLAFPLLGSVPGTYATDTNFSGNINVTGSVNAGAINAASGSADIGFIQVSNLEAYQSLFVEGVFNQGLRFDNSHYGYTVSYLDGYENDTAYVDYSVARPYAEWTWSFNTDLTVTRGMSLHDGSLTLFDVTPGAGSEYPGLVLNSLSGSVRSVIAYRALDVPTGSVNFHDFGTSSTGVSLGAGGGSPTLYVRTNGGIGKVGIGVTDPAERLDVSGNIKLSGNIITSTGALTLPASGALLATTGSGPTTRLLVGGTTSPSSAWQGTSVLGADGQNKVIAGYLGSSTGGAIIGSHNSALNAWADLNVAGQNLIFRTAGETERMRIDSSGNVGIGTTAPATKLHISSSGTSSGRGLRIQTTGTGTDSYAEAQFVTTTRDYRIGAGGSGADTALGLANKFYIWDSQSGARAVIDTNGNVGIGTTSPSSANFGVGTNKLDVVGSSGINIAVQSSGNYAGFVAAGAAEADLSLRDTGAASGSQVWNLVSNDGTLSFRRLGDGYTPVLSIPMVIDALGNVGVGTTSPSVRLEVNGDAKVSGSLTVGGATVATTSSTQTWSGTQTFNAPTRFTTSSTTANPDFVIGNDTGLGLFLTAWGSNQGGTRFGLSRNSMSLIEGQGTGPLVLGTNASAAQPLIFGTNGSERMRIDSAGNVGIGTPAPNAKLQVAGDSIFGVAGTSQGANSITFRSDSAAANADLFSLNFQRSNYSPTGVAAAIVFGREANAFEGNLSFRTYNGGTVNNSSGSLVERLRITADGNVAIGTAPSSAGKLRVAGDAAFLGNGSVPNAPAEAGVYLGNSQTDTNRRIEIVSPAGGTSYIDFTTPGTDLQGRIAYNLVNNSFAISTANTQRITIDASGNVGITGALAVNGAAVLTATGNGSGLTGLNATQLTTGTLPLARLDSSVLTTTSDVAAAKLTGTLPTAVLPATVVQVDSTQSLTNKTLIGTKLAGTTTIGGSSAATQVVFDESGGVGIGAAVPSAGTKLDVNGAVRIAGTITLKNVGTATSVILIPKAGDIDMGDFTAGTNPNL